MPICNQVINKIFTEEVQPDTQRMYTMLVES